MKDIVNKIASGSAFNLINAITKWIRAIFVSVVIARMLGPTTYGLYTLIFWIITIAGMFVTLGFTTTTAKYISEYKGKNDDRSIIGILRFILTFEFVTGTAVTLIVIFSSSFLANVFSQSKFSYFLIIAAIGILPNAILDISSYVFNGLQQFKYSALTTLVTSLCAIFVVPLILFLGYGIMGLIIVNLVIIGIGLISVMYLLRKEIPLHSIFKITISQDVKKRIIKYNTYMMAIIFFDMIVNQRTEVFFLGYFRSPEEVAFYSVSFGIAAFAMNLLPGSLTGVLLPVMSETHGREDKAKLKRLFIESTRYLMNLAIPICIGGIVLAEQIINVIYGPKYGPAVPALRILFISACALIISSGAAGLQYGIERQDFILKLGIILAILNVSLDIFLIPKYGIMGAVWANSTSQIIGVITSQIFTCRLLKIKWPLQHFIRVLFSSLLMVPFVFIMKMFLKDIYALLSGILVGVIVYFFSVVLTKAITRDDVLLLERLKQNFPAAIQNKYGFVMNFIKAYNRQHN